MASLTGEGDDSGDSALSYSKLIYRLKNVPILSVKNAEPGKAVVRFGRTDSGDSYVLQWSEKEDMKDAKTRSIRRIYETRYICRLTGDHIIHLIEYNRIIKIQILSLSAIIEPGDMPALNIGLERNTQCRGKVYLICSFAQFTMPLSKKQRKREEQKPK